MKILHTSDWHLGKRLFKLDRSAEHEQFLNWLLATLIEQKVDILLIAGDVFDTPTPPHQSLELFYDFLHRVSSETTTDTYIIAGNHDSGLLLEAPSKLLTHHRVKVWGKLSPIPSDHWTQVVKGKEALDLCAIPFFRSHELLRDGEDDAIRALKKYLTKKRTAPQLLMLHHLAGMYEAAGSEHVISLSGVDSIPTEILNDFDYVALGHIHKPQKIGPKSFYSGSPIPLRFNETLGKSVILIDQTDSKITSQTLPIPLARPLIQLKVNETNWKEKIEALPTTSSLTPMVEIQLTLSAPRMGLIEEIKQSLEKKEMELLSFMPTYIGEAETERNSSRLFELSTVELFTEFYALKYPNEPQVPEDLMSDFTTLLDKVKNAPGPTPD
ncbi:MAG TPA: exonuclease subunit SbcD [Bacteriovoracaceae bacterium]|nr:exonuclease subunit SbcD [Bacteriovoracaceae bacterium]